MQSTFDTDNLKETAEFYRLALGMGLLGVDEVIAWCDEVITTHPDPPLAVIRASMVPGKKMLELEKELAQLEGEADFEAVIRQLFGRLLEGLKPDRSNFLEIIHSLDNSFLQYEEFAGKSLASEVVYFVEMASLIEDEDIALDYREKLAQATVEEFTDFLKKAAEGKTTTYSE